MEYDVTMIRNESAKHAFDKKDLLTGILETDPKGKNFDLHNKPVKVFHV
jgi:hypothetical protein